MGASDELLISADKNPNSNGARALGIAPAELGANLPRIAEGIKKGQIKTLLVFGEDAAKHLGADTLRQVEALFVSDILPNAAVNAAHVVLPGCAHAEKRGTFTNAKGRVQKFMAAVTPPGDARPELEFLREILTQVGAGVEPATVERLFDQMAHETPAFAGLTWAALGDQGQPATLAAEGKV
jgi:predicted molibdopterin-dependent oxidoreductase YjgC